MSRGWSSSRGGVLSRAGLGVLDWFIPGDVVDEAVGDGLAWEMRLRSVPARTGVLFVLGLALFGGSSYRGVMRKLVRGLGGALGAEGWAVPASTALTGARRRAGEKTLAALFGRLCSALSPGRAPWSHIGGLLVAAWDGTTVTVPASGENIAAFGRERAKGGGWCSPQVRLVSLMACGTRALLGAAMGPVTGKGSGEQALARDLLGCLHRGMLLLADRNFYSWALWHAAAGTGADLLWRVKSSQRIGLVRVLPDGSWLGVIRDPAAVRRRTARNKDRRRRGSKLPPDAGPVPGIIVRVIEFRVRAEDEDGVTRTTSYLVITTLTDLRRYPAGDLAAVYGWRWAIETGYREFKTYLRGPGRVLRSQTPALARQEIWAYLCIYQAIRAVICHAAAGAGLDPDRLSFTTALDQAREDLAGTSTRDALTQTGAILLAGQVPARPGRVWLRAITQPRHPWPARKTAGTLAHHTSYTVEITSPGTPAQTTASQHKQPTTPPNQPP